MTNQVENETKSGASKKKWKLRPWMLTGVLVPLAVAIIAYLGNLVFPRFCAAWVKCEIYLPRIVLG